MMPVLALAAIMPARSSYVTCGGTHASQLLSNCLALRSYPRPSQCLAINGHCEPESYLITICYSAFYGLRNASQSQSSAKPTERPTKSVLSRLQGFALLRRAFAAAKPPRPLIVWSRIDHRDTRCAGRHSVWRSGFHA